MSKSKRNALKKKAYELAREELDNFRENVLADFIKFRKSAPQWAYALNLGDGFDQGRKVGDTGRGYWGVFQRLNEEWGLKFPHAYITQSFPLMLDKNHYVRDYYLHEILREWKFHNYTREELLAWFKDPNAYSSEVFEVTDVDVRAAYHYFCLLWDHNMIDWSKVYTIKPSETIPEEQVFIVFRPLQEEAERNYLRASENGRDNLIMWACPRFGKCVTVMGIAEAAKMNCILVSCAISNVEDEWRFAAENILNFKDWVFVNDEQLKSKPNIVQELLAAGKKVLVFLTYQATQGNKVKPHHKKLMEIDFDLHASDETHTGARGPAFSAKFTMPDVNEEEFVTPEEQAELKDYIASHFKVKSRLGLSGTPYNIMMTDEYAEEDIICRVTYADILHERNKWWEENPDRPTWENPYFDFPDLLTLGIVMESKDSAIYRAMAKAGAGEFTDIFDVDIENHCPKYPELLWKFFAAVDGTLEDSGIYPFLNDSIIRQRIGNIQGFMIFSRIAQVDIIVDWLEEHKHEFKNLKDWRFFKATSHKKEMKAKDIKRAVAQCEKDGINTLTFTVGKMMTGVTVKQWNLGINARPLGNAQFYDQSGSRSLSGFSEDVELVAPDGSIIKAKRVLKTQSIFIDLVPERELAVAASRAQIRAASENNGVIEPAEVIKNLEYDLSVMPHVMMDNQSGMLVPVTPTNVMHAATKYASRRSLVEQTKAFESINQEWFNHTGVGAWLKNAVGTERQNDLKLVMQAFSSEDGKYSEIDPNDMNAAFGLLGDARELSKKMRNELATKQKELEALVKNGDAPESKKAKKELADIENAIKRTKELDDAARRLNEEYIKKQRTLLIRIATYAWCAGAEYKIFDYKSLLKSLKHKYNPRYKACQRIAEHLELNAQLIEDVYKAARQSDKSELNALVYRLYELSHDDNLTDDERLAALFNNFRRINSSEVVTPTWVCDFMMSDACYSDDELLNMIAHGEKILIVADEIGEQSIAVYKRLKELGVAMEDIRSAIWCIPSSEIAYEMCVRTFKMFGLDERNIAVHFDANSIYGKLTESEKTCDRKRALQIIKDTLSRSKTGFLCDDTLEKDANKDAYKMIKFGTAVGNPPYQNAKIGNTNTMESAYDEFVDLTMELADKNILIIPARWLFNAGRTPKAWNKKMLNSKHIRVLYYNPNMNEVFTGVTLKGGVCIIEYNKDAEFDPIILFDKHEEMRSVIDKVRTQSDRFVSDIAHSNAACHFTDALYDENPELLGMMSENNEFNMQTNVVQTLGDKIFLDAPPSGKESEYVTLHARPGNSRVTKLIKETYVTGGTDYWRVGIPASNGKGDFGETIAEPFVIAPHDVYTQTYMAFGKFKTEQEARNFAKYLRSKMVRALLGTLKVTHHNGLKVWQRIPIQDFTENSDIDWTKSIAEIDQQLYKKYGLNEDEISFIETNVKAM